MLVKASIFRSFESFQIPPMHSRRSNEDGGGERTKRRRQMSPRVFEGKGKLGEAFDRVKGQRVRRESEFKVLESAPGNRCAAGAAFNLQ